MRSYILFYFVLCSLILIGACSSKKDQVIRQDKPGVFPQEEIDVSSIPDEPVRGFLNGKEVSFSYINFEKWRGSGDNVLNFSVVQPEHQCGYIENFQGFELINRKNEIEQGNWVKTKFNDDPKTFNAFYQFRGPDSSFVKSTCTWACALKIDNMDNKKVTGKIVLTFDDENKSWIAGKFEAIICNN